jgi:hypothetical protein
MDLDWYLSFLERVCTSCFPPLSTLEHLYIHDGAFLLPHLRQSQDNTDYTLWLELLRPFADVKNLYISEEFMPRITPALQELVGDRTTEVLPTLQNLFLEVFSRGQAPDAIKRFVAARQIAGRPISTFSWGNQSSPRFIRGCRGPLTL